jgi:hypothetical protein
VTEEEGVRPRELAVRKGRKRNHSKECFLENGGVGSPRGQKQ